MDKLHKRWIRAFCGTGAFDMGVRMLEGMRDNRTDLLRVLTYHRISDDVDGKRCDASLISARPEQFKRQMEFLADVYHPVSLEEVIRSTKCETSLPPRAVLITFDDAYQDFATDAWPVLKTLGIPVVMFVPTAFPDGTQNGFWWDRLYSALVLSEIQSDVQTPWGTFSMNTDEQRRSSFREIKHRLWTLPHEDLVVATEDFCSQRDDSQFDSDIMSWKILRQLAQEGVTLAPHTHSHPLLNRISPSMVREEVCRSRRELKERIGEAPPAFAYPSGHFNAQVVNILREEGFAVGFTTLRGINRVGVTDKLRLRRNNVGPNSPDALLRVQLLAITRHLNRPTPDCFPYQALA